MSEAQGTSIKSRQRVSWSADERAQWLELFRGSGVSAAEFCRANDLSPATLSFWLRQPVSSESNAELGAAFVEVPVPSAPTSVEPTSPAVTLHLPSRVRLEIAAGADAVWLGELVRALSSAGA